MANTHTLIYSSTAGSGGTSSFDFTSIPSTYTDLLLKISIRSSSSVGTYDPVKIKINGSATNITVRDIYATGSSVGSEAPGSTDANIISYSSNSANTSNAFGSLEIYISNYASTSYAKSISADGVSETNGAGAILTLTSSLWNSTSAINAVNIGPYLGGSTWAQYSTASLYGIKNS